MLFCMCSAHLELLRADLQSVAHVDEVWHSLAVQYNVDRNITLGCCI